MAEVIDTTNTNAYDAQKKFVDFEGLDYFWEKAKDYIDESDNVTSQAVSDNKTTIENISNELMSINDKIDSIEKGNLTWTDVQ